MSEKNNGGPAFPFKEKTGTAITPGPDGRRTEEREYFERHPGMTLRDWFAGQALASLIARHRADVAWSEVAPTAYGIADAMLKARGS